MYRFLLAQNVFTYITCKNKNMALPSRMCSFCNFYHPKLTKPFSHQFRHASTTTNTAMLNAPVKKKVKRKTKKYAELLEVTDSTSSNKKAAVQKLNAHQLSMFADQPGIELDEIYKIKRPTSKKTKKKTSSSIAAPDLPSFSNALSLQEDHELEKHDDIKDFSIGITVFDEVNLEIAEEIEMSDDLQSVDLLKNTTTDLAVEANPKNVTTKSKKKTKKKVKQDEKKVLDNDLLNLIATKEKQKNFNRGLLAYVDVCKNIKMVDQVHETLMDLKKNTKETHYSFKDIKVLNAILHKYASTGNFTRVNELFKQLLNDEIKASPQTYAAVLECIGRRNRHTNLKLHLDDICRGMMKNNITLNDVVINSILVNDQQEKVLKAIRILQPNFTPIYKKPEITYSNKMMQGLTCTNNVKISPAKGLFTQEEMKQFVQTQLNNEIRGSISIKSVEATSEPDKYTRNCRARLEKLEGYWKATARKVFKRNLNILKNREAFNQRPKCIHLYPYLSILEPDVYVEAIMREARKMAEGSYSYSPSLSFLCRELGAYVYQKHELQMKLKYKLTEKVATIHNDYCDWYLARNDGYNSRAKWSILEYKAIESGSSLDMVVPQWTSNILCSIGRFLYNIILYDLKINNNFVKIQNKNHLPAFYAIYRAKSIEMKQEVKPHMSLVKLFRDSKPEMLTFDASLVPSVCPPRPWLSIHSGGYLTTKVDIVRLTPETYQVWERLAEVNKQQLYPVLDALNQLGSIPWKINSPVLDIAAKIFREGGNAKLDVPETLSNLSPMPRIKKNATKGEQLKFYKEKMAMLKKRNEMYSLWCDGLYKLSLANYYRDKTFWLPHNMDFRGRVYPVPPHLTHVSSDLARSLLVFAIGKPLGPKGLDWLKIHTINLTGLKKRESIDNRLAYANEIIDKILDSAKNPMTGEMWWSKSDEPWQTLAACMEISKALKHQNPEEYISAFPLHQDGSCNGLQHYAALGRDIIGAKSVNLRPSEVPQDVYSGVAASVEKQRVVDAENDVKIAIELDGFISRKVIKQTVMTTVYGVTKFGAKLQIARQLKAIEGFKPENIWLASAYLANSMFGTLRTMFKSTREIQDWLTESTRLVTQIREQNMAWQTPLGLPIVQPYTRSYKMRDKNIEEKPNVMKQKNAFPPNFIHSLDSTHMMLTSLHCEHHGLTFVSVHDCFWTHCCTVAQMNKICREQFVALHSQPILEDLSKYLLQKYKFSDSELENTKSPILKREKLKLNQILSEIPERGQLDLKEVLSSVYFFN